MSRRSRITPTAIAVLALACIVLPVRAATTYADIAPLLEQKCALCHRGEAAPSGLRLDTYEGVIAGSSNGPVVKANFPSDSELVRRVKGISQPRMPLTGPPYLADEEIEKLEDWIAGGLVEGDAPAAPGVAEPLLPAPGETVTYRHVAPIFAARCVKCHAKQGMMGGAPEGFELTSHQSTLSSSDRLRVVPGNPAASELFRRIIGQSVPRMPFDGPPFLTSEETRVIEDWIAQGASNAEGVASAIPAGARIRLHGKLTGRWSVDDLDLAVGTGTRIDKSPRPGDFVEVRGRIDAGGTIAVERLRRR